MTLQDAREWKRKCQNLFPTNIGRNIGVVATEYIDTVPGVGHMKGVIHYVCGNMEAGDNAMKSASRNVGVMGGAAAGFVVGRPPGCVLGAVAGVVAMDLVTTTVDAAVHGKHRPSGIVRNLPCVINNPNDLNGYLDLAVPPLMIPKGGYKKLACLVKNTEKKESKKESSEAPGKMQDDRDTS